MLTSAKGSQPGSVWGERIPDEGTAGTRRNAGGGALTEDGCVTDSAPLGAGRAAAAPDGGGKVVRGWHLLSRSRPLAPGSGVELGLRAQRPQAGQEAIFTAATDDEGMAPS